MTAVTGIPLPLHRLSTGSYPAAAEQLVLIGQPQPIQFRSPAGGPGSKTPRSRLDSRASVTDVQTACAGSYATRRERVSTRRVWLTALIAANACVFTCDIAVTVKARRFMRAARLSPSSAAPARCCQRHTGRSMRAI